jgi:phosphoglycerate dehydrogenase-like enzyme
MIVVAIAEPLRSRILPPPLMAELLELGPVALAPPLADSDDTRNLLAEAEILVTGWGSRLVDADVLAIAPRLRAAVHTAGSVRSVVTPEVYARGVVVSSQAWANALPVAEYTLAMILLSAKGVLRMRDRYRKTLGKIDVQEELDGFGTYRVQVGIIGASTIGLRVIELLRPFDLNVALYDPTVSADEAAALGVRALTLDELIRTSREVARICRGEALHHEVQADAYERLA